MFRSLFIWLLFSNAVTLIRDKSILVPGIVIVYASIKTLCRIIIIAFLFVVFIYALFKLLKLAIRYLLNIVIIIVYLYLLSCFMMEALFNELYSPMITIIVILSFLSLCFFYIRYTFTNRKGVSSLQYLPNILHFVKNNYSLIFIVFITIWSGKYVIYNELIMLDSFASRLFCSFSFVLPTYVFSSIIRNAYIKFSVEPSIRLHYWLFSEIITLNNYYIKVENLSVTTLTYFLFCSVVITTIDIEGAVNLHSSRSVIKDNSIYTSYSYDDIVYPADSGYNFDDSIISTLNIELSLSLGELVRSYKETIDNFEWAPDLEHVRFDHEKVKYFRTSEGLFYKEAYLKQQATNYIRNNRITQIPYSHSWDVGPKNRVCDNLADNEGVMSALDDVREDSSSEANVDEYVMTLLTNFFDSKRGFRFAPQAKEGCSGRGKIDILLKYKTETRIVIENKREDKTSWLYAASQLRDYCYNDNNFETVFAVIFKGTKFAAFVYDKDFHSDRNFY